MLFFKLVKFKKLCKIFNKFYQIDESHASQGNGIGLAIVRKVTDLHNGSISVQSDHSSTTFTILLPRNMQESK